MPAQKKASSKRKLIGEQESMLLRNALAEAYQEWRRHAMGRWRSHRFFPVSMLAA
jgi:hypothetical protein